MEMHHDSDNDNRKPPISLFRMMVYKPPTVDGDNVFAVLHYEGAPDTDPKGDARKAFKKGDELEEHLLVPLFNPEAPGGATADHIIDLKFTEDKNDTTGHRIVSCTPFSLEC